MYGSQIERLKKDCREMDFYIKKHEKRGDNKKAYDLLKKKEYMLTRIEELQEELAA